MPKKKNKSGAKASAAPAPAGKIERKLAGLTYHGYESNKFLERESRSGLARGMTRIARAAAARRNKK